MSERPQATGASSAAAVAFEWVLSSEQATRQLAADIAALLRPGDVVTLAGDLGAGKSTLARSLIRHLAADDTLEVPSPTFTLLQHYDLDPFPLLHIDLYRVGNVDELTELGFGDTADDAVSLIEWPERAGAQLPEERLEVALALAPGLEPDRRRVRIVGRGAWAARIHRIGALGKFLDEAGYGEAGRVPVQGDASTRIYERLTRGDRSAILMNAPRRPDGPPVRDGRPYSAIAHLAEDVVPFVALARGLHERGFSAPQIYAADLYEGLLILEDLNAEGVVTGVPPVPIEERYTAALDVLVALHRTSLPDTLAVAPNLSYRLPSYDLDAFLIEVELLPDWYLPQQGNELSAALRVEFLQLWRDALAAAIAAPPTWVLRDYHSPNLLWLPERQDIARVGLLDFQDALMGPAAYDVVSLLQDARVDVPEALEEALLTRYLKARRAADRTFDLGQFIALYALMGAQRASKVLGIFARLDRRDGKPQYLRHQPRVWRNLRRALAHPVLAPLKAWYEAHVAPQHPG
jgi:tRNA threonylcarbamoyl adenosine modification protein YjeE